GKDDGARVTDARTVRRVRTNRSPEPDAAWLVGRDYRIPPGDDSARSVISSAVVDEERRGVEVGRECVNDAHVVGVTVADVFVVERIRHYAARLRVAVTGSVDSRIRLFKVWIAGHAALASRFIVGYPIATDGWKVSRAA